MYYLFQIQKIPKYFNLFYIHLKKLANISWRNILGKAKEPKITSQFLHITPSVIRSEKAIFRKFLAGNILCQLIKLEDDCVSHLVQIAG